jgi:hypothetical protein
MAGPLLFLEPIVLAPNVNHMRVVQQSVRDGSGNEGIAEDLGPLTEPLV